MMSNIKTRTTKLVQRGRNLRAINGASTQAIKNNFNNAGASTEVMKGNNSDKLKKKLERNKGDKHEKAKEPIEPQQNAITDKKNRSAG